MYDRSSYSEVLFADLRSVVRSYVDNKRFSHILSVEKKACEMAAVFQPEKANIIRTAAILHDLTKNLTDEENLSICHKYGFTPVNGLSSKLLHAITAPLLISGELSEKYPVLNDPEILGAIRWHTTGRNGMSMSEAIVYLSDYIEDTRQYDVCIKIREYYESGLDSTGIEKYLHFYKTMVICLGYTINHLKNLNSEIDCNTLEARDYYLKKIQLFKKGTCFR